MSEEKEHHPLVPYGLYVKIWIILVILTVITVGACYLDMKKLTVLTAMIIATTKAHTLMPRSLKPVMTACVATHSFHLLSCIFIFANISIY